MKAHARMNCKDSEIIFHNCIIEDIVELDEVNYAEFCINPLGYYDFISDRKDLMYKNDEDWHCILVMGENQVDGIFAESEGYDYARYTALFPNAREFVNAQIKQLANYIISEGTEHTEDGKWLNSYDELYYHFGAVVNDTNGTGQLLREELAEREEVSECILCEDCVEISYHLEHCPQCSGGGVGGMMSLFSLMGCNLEDVHLCDSDEEHELATITELNQNTLTEDGKAEWADILSAKVERVYTGYFGLQIGLSGASPDRLRDFSYMLAGHCSAEDYEKWITPDEPGQLSEME